MGTPRHFYDELRIPGLVINKGDLLRIQPSGTEKADGYCILSAILVSTTFPTAGKDNDPDNNFSGRTVVDNCTIARSRDFDHEWGWRGAIEICLDHRNISGLTISRVRIDSSLSFALSIVAGKSADATLSAAILQSSVISGYGLGKKGSHALFIAAGARGNLTIKTLKGTTDILNRSRSFVPRP